MNTITRYGVLLLAILFTFASGIASAQINFEKSGYYLSLGDSVAAGEGALPVNHSFVYQLYDRGVFGQTKSMDFANIAIKGVTSDEILALQVPQAICIQPPRIAVAPSVITLSAGANDFLLYMANPQNLDPTKIPAIAEGIADNVSNIIGLLVFGNPALPPYCATQGITNVTVLVSNYYHFNHPDPQVDYLLNLALDTFDQRMRANVLQIKAAIQASGRNARVGYVDTLSAMDGKQGLLLIEKRNGFNGLFDFEIHPTNAGHSFIAAEFAKVWESLQ